MPLPVLRRVTTPSGPAGRGVAPPVTAPFPWLAVWLLCFWCLLVGVFAGDVLPLPPPPRGLLRVALAAVLALGVARSVWGLRLAVRAWTARGMRGEQR